jgi:hypothetical protein
MQRSIAAGRLPKPESPPASIDSTQLKSASVGYGIANRADMSLPALVRASFIK